MITQQVWEQERREREQEKNEVSMKISAIFNALEQQQKLLATNQQAIKEELTQEMSGNVKSETNPFEETRMCTEYGVPSESKIESPGLLREVITGG